MKKLNTGKKTEINRVLFPIPFRPSKNTLKKSKFYQNKSNNMTGENINKDNCLYVWAIFSNVSEILKIKKNFPNMSLKKIYKMINNSSNIMGHFGHEQFSFLFLLFSDFIGILFSFSFLLDNEEAHDIAVTWRVTWCDIIRPRIW